jgi:hypothetical protein
VKGFEILGIAPFSDEDTYAAGNFFAGLFDGLGFVVGRDAYPGIPAESFSGEQRGMPVNWTSMLLCKANLAEEVRVVPQDGINVHDFGKKMVARIGKKLADVLGIDGVRTVFKSGGGDTGRDAESEIER